MRARVGWPLGTLAAFVVGYVGAAVVAPPGASKVPSGPGDTGSAQRVAAPTAWAPAWVNARAGAASVETPGTPPPLRGSLAPRSADPVPRGETTDGPDWGFVSAEDLDVIRVRTRRVFGIDAALYPLDGREADPKGADLRWYDGNDQGAPANAR